MMVLGALLLRTVTHLPGDTPDQEQGRSLRRQFGIIVTLEGLALTGVTLVCVFLHRWALIAPLDLIIVGLHFLPLARLFKVPRYYALGSLFVGIPVLTMVLIPAGEHLGQAFSWLVIPSVGCAFVALAIAGFGLREVGRFIHTSVAPLP